MVGSHCRGVWLLLRNESPALIGTSPDEVQNCVYYASTNTHCVFGELRARLGDDEGQQWPDIPSLHASDDLSSLRFELRGVAGVGLLLALCWIEELVRTQSRVHGAYPGKEK